MHIDTENKTLTLGPESGTTLDLGTVIRAHLYDIMVTRDKVVTEFEPRLVHPIQGWGHNIWNHAVMELTTE